MKPLAIDLYSGLFGWGAAFAAAGWDVIGLDIEDMGLKFDQARPPGCQLVLQDVLTLHGSQFRNATVIVASPPCQEYSYMAMPWKRAKKIAEEYRSGVRDAKQLTALFDACFRIQHEASEAAGRHIPLIVENVKGAQPWVGRAKWHYGSYYLWGDVPALMPFSGGVMKTGDRNQGRVNGEHRWSHSFADTKNNGGSWVAVAHNTESGNSRNPVRDGTKHHASGPCWFDGTPDKMLGHFGPAKFGSRSDSRKDASAMIAKIPFPLAEHIAKVYKENGS